jgi:hypothetical protein
MKKITKQLTPITEIIIGLILLVKELYEMTVLPSINDDINDTYGLVDFAKYKENTYSLIFFWTFVLLIGVISFRNNQSKWFANQTLVFTVFFGSFIAIIFSLIYKSPIGLVWGLILIGTIIAEYLYYKSPLTKELKPTKIHIAICLTIGLLSAILFWTIDITQLNYKLTEVL